MLREISLPVHSSEYLIRAFLPVDYPQLTNITGQRNTGINYVESRWFRAKESSHLIRASEKSALGKIVTFKYLVNCASIR